MKSHYLCSMKVTVSKQLIMIIGVAAQPLLSFSAEVSDSSHVVDLDEVVVVSHPKEHVMLRNLPLSSTMIGAHQIDILWQATHCAAQLFAHL